MKLFCFETLLLLLMRAFSSGVGEERLRVAAGAVELLTRFDVGDMEFTLVNGTWVELELAPEKHSENKTKCLNVFIAACILLVLGAIGKG